ncbi:unnamed protein product [Gordionus sp. m RMFG-2023]
MSSLDNNDSKIDNTGVYQKTDVIGLAGKNYAAQGMQLSSTNSRIAQALMNPRYDFNTYTDEIMHTTDPRVLPTPRDKFTRSEWNVFCVIL